MQEYFSSKGEIYYRKNAFQANKETLIFIHGLSGSCSAWLKYEDKFKDKYNILTFDLRGHGESKKYKKYSDYDVQNFIEDIDEILVSLNIDKFNLISHSFGSIVALEMIRKYEQRVSSVIFLAPAFNAIKGSRDLMAKVIIDILAGLARLFPISIRPGKHIDYSLFPNTPDYSIRRIYTDVHNTGLRIYLFCLKHVYAFNGDAYLPFIKTKTLLVHGKNDRIIDPSHSIENSKKIVGSKLILLDNANHILVLNNFSEIIQIIEEFLNNKITP